MHILILEDEMLASQHLLEMIQQELPSAVIHDPIDSIEDAVGWLQAHPAPDLVFMDIHLADGLSFEIFKQLDLTAPVIFTTAYNQYALDAFQANSVDYLLKPIDPDKLKRAIQKYQRTRLVSPDTQQIQALLAQLPASAEQRTYQERFLVKIGTQYRAVMTTEIAYFLAEEGMVYLVREDGKRLPVDDKLEAIESRLNPRQFFRLNRKFLARIRSIGRIHAWFNSRLKVELNPPTEHEIVVSRDRVHSFKSWLNS